jgi:hypothetical protein
MGKIWIGRPGSGLLEPFEVPDLTMEASISRGWELHGDLLEPRAPEREYLTTTPLPGFTLNWYWGTRCLEPGKLLQGLPAL